MIKEHLIQMASVSGSDYYLWLAENGKVFSDKKVVKPPSYVKVKQCYSNSLKYAMMKGCDYVEGFYVTEFPIPFEHAFNLQDGKLIDVTATKFGIRVSEYFGIVLSQEVIQEYVLSNCPEWMMPLQYYYETTVNKKTWKKNGKGSFIGG